MRLKHDFKKYDLKANFDSLTFSIFTHALPFNHGNFVRVQLRSPIVGTLQYIIHWWMTMPQLRAWHHRRKPRGNQNSPCCAGLIRCSSDGRSARCDANAPLWRNVHRTSLSSERTSPSPAASVLPSSHRLGTYWMSNTLKFLFFSLVNMKSEWIPSKYIKIPWQFNLHHRFFESWNLHGSQDFPSSHVWFPKGRSPTVTGVENRSLSHRQPRGDCHDSYV